MITFRRAGDPPLAERPSPALLWIGLLLPPAVFLIDLGASFALVEHTCRTGARGVSWAVTLASLALAAGGIWSAWTAWRGIGPDPHPSDEGVEHSSPRSSGHALAQRLRTDAAGPEGRQRFMALSGLLLGSFFFVVILASVVPALLIAPCA